MGIEESKIQSKDTKRSPTTTLEKRLDLLDIKNIEKNILVWCDPNIDKDEDGQILQARFREIFTYFTVYNKVDSCKEWLNKRSNKEKVFLIVSGRFGSEMIPDIHHLKSIISIYVFCFNPSIHHMWAENYTKIRQVTRELDQLFEQIYNDQFYFDKIQYSESSQIFNDQNDQTSLKNDSFIWFQLFLEILMKSSYLPSFPSSNLLIEKLNQYYSTDKETLKLIEQFNSKYFHENVLTFLRQKSPLTSILKQALCDENILLLFYLRFFLFDISKQISNYQLSLARVYRKQFMSLDQIRDIEKNQNNFLIFNEFLITTTRKPEFSLNDIDNDQEKTVFIEIDAERRKNTPPFACIQENNVVANNTDKNIVFMCHSIFKIISFEMNEDSTWTLKLSLNDNPQSNILNEKKRQLDENKNLLIIADLLEQLNQNDKANIYCQHLLEELPTDHILRNQIKQRLEIKSTPQKITPNTIQFIVVDLIYRLTEFASAILFAIQSLTNDYILIYDNNSDINFDSLPDKTIYLFTSSQYISSMKIKPKQKVINFILEENKNNVDQRERFRNSEDLMFELADQLARSLKLDSQNNQNFSKEKEQLAGEIHKELEKLFRKFHQDKRKNQQTICTDTKIFWLQSEENHDVSLTILQKLLKNIGLPCFSLRNEQECFQSLCTNEYKSSIFLIIDVYYDDSYVNGFKSLGNIKNIYKYGQSSKSSEHYFDHIDDLYIQLIHDLITHYNKMANQSTKTNDRQKAKEMFKTAEMLCEKLIDFEINKN